MSVDWPLFAALDDVNPVLKKVPACKLANLCFVLDLSDMLSDEEEKENLSPGEVPTTVVIDSFGKTFEDAVSIYV